MFLKIHIPNFYFVDSIVFRHIPTYICSTPNYRPLLKAVINDIISRIQLGFKTWCCGLIDPIYGTHSHLLHYIFEVVISIVVMGPLFRYFFI